MLFEAGHLFHASYTSRRCPKAVSRRHMLVCIEFASYCIFYYYLLKLRLCLIMQTPETENVLFIRQLGKHDI
jgi:hypothetical protein